MSDDDIVATCQNLLNREREHSKEGIQEAIRLVPEDQFHDNYCHYLETKAIFIRKNIPEFMSSGTHQIVLRLSASHVAKLPLEREIRLDDYWLTNCYSSTSPSTDKTLPLLGIKTIPHHYFYVDITNGLFVLSDEERDEHYNASVVITDDLTGNGRYKLIGLDDDVLKLSNGAKILREYDVIQEKILHQESMTRPKFEISANSHIFHGTIDEAIRHMFFVQVNPEENTGTLIAGDLDHIHIYKSYWHKDNAAFRSMLKKKYGKNS